MAARCPTRASQMTRLTRPAPSNLPFSSRTFRIESGDGFVRGKKGASDRGRALPIWTPRDLLVNVVFVRTILDIDPPLILGNRNS